MPKIITIILLAMATIPVYAQEQVDTLKPQELNEVVVQAQMQCTSSAKSTYILSGKQKNAAQTAVDLLRQMAIPQIRINPIDEMFRRHFVSRHRTATQLRFSINLHENIA